MIQALETHMPPDVTFTRPQGGMFLWVEGPEGFDMEELYWKAVKRNVAFAERGSHMSITKTLTPWGNY